MTNAIYAEVRPNVRACNFFVKTTVNVESSSVKIDATEIEISSFGPLRLKLPPGITLVPESFSGFICLNDEVLFRTQIATFSLLDKVKLSPLTYSPGVDKNENCLLICSNCQGHLSGELSFSRILPLPSNEELNDFFCHRHSDENISLDPCASDLFYNCFFFKISVQNLKIVEGVNQFKCPSCSTLHGEINGKCVKLWNSTVRISLPSSEQRRECILDNFMKSLKYFVKDLPLQMNKFVFTCSQGAFPTHYTLVWILDRSLVLLTGTHHSGDGSVNLDFRNVMKVLYRHCTEIDDDVKAWLDSFTSSVIPIPSKVELDFLSYLAKMSERIPSDSNNVNGMTISYLELSNYM